MDRLGVSKDNAEVPVAIGSYHVFKHQMGLLAGVKSL